MSWKSGNVKSTLKDITTAMIGVSSGSVTFQHCRQGVAPAHEDASWRDGGMGHGHASSEIATHGTARQMFDALTGTADLGVGEAEPGAEPERVRKEKQKQNTRGQHEQQPEGVLVVKEVAHGSSLSSPPWKGGVRAKRAGWFDARARTTTPSPPATPLLHPGGGE